MENEFQEFFNCLLYLYELSHPDFNKDDVGFSEKKIESIKSDLFENFPPILHNFFSCLGNAKIDFTFIEAAIYNGYNEDPYEYSEYMDYNDIEPDVNLNELIVIGSNQEFLCGILKSDQSNDPLVYTWEEGECDQDADAWVPFSRFLICLFEEEYAQYYKKSQNERIDDDKLKAIHEKVIKALNASFLQE